MLIITLKKMQQNSSWEGGKKKQLNTHTHTNENKKHENLHVLQSHGKLRDISKSLSLRKLF